MKPSNKTNKPFRINPVEFLIFAFFAAVFTNSLYNLFYDHQGNPVGDKLTLTAPAAPAAEVAGAYSLELKCDATNERATDSSKLRITGMLCTNTGSVDSRSPASKEDLKVSTISVSNENNHFNATVFTDFGGSKYSTDYIPLSSGKNVLKVVYTLESGKTINQSLTVTKN